MKQNKIMLLTLLIGAVSVFVLFSFTGNTSHGFKKFARKYKAPSFQKVLNFEVDYRATDIRYINESIYIRDFSNQQIVQYNSYGELIRAYGKKGRGPGENNLIISWDIDRKLYLIDGSLLTIQEKSINDSLVTYYKPKFYFTRAFHLDKSNYLFISQSDISYKKNKYFMHDIVSEKSKELNLTLPETEDDLSLDGNFIRNSQHQYFYVCYMSGVFISFNKSGELLYRGKTIDETPIPEVVNVTNTARMIDPKAPYANLTFSSNNKYLFIQSARKAINERSEKVFPLDVYDVKNGQYLFSIEPPMNDDENMDCFYVDDSNKIYSIYGNNVFIYQMTI